MSDDTTRTITVDDLDELFERLEVIIEENSIDESVVYGVQTAHSIKLDPNTEWDTDAIARIRNMNRTEIVSELQRMERLQVLRFDTTPFPTPAIDRLNEYLERYPPPESLQHRKTADDWAYERLPQSMQDIVDRINRGEVPAMVDVVWAFETEEPTFELRLVAFIHFLQYYIIPFLAQGNLPRDGFKRLIWIAIKSYMWRISFDMGHLGFLVD